MLLIQSWVCNPWYEQTRFEGGYILDIRVHVQCLPVCVSIGMDTPTPTVVCRNNRCSYESPFMLSLTKWPTENAGSDQSLVIAESNSVFSAIPSTLLTVVYMCITWMWMWTYMYAPIGSNGCHLFCQTHTCTSSCYLTLVFFLITLLISNLFFNLITQCYVIIH